MGVVVRNSIKTSVIIYIGIVLGAFNTLWLFPYCFSPEQIGLLRLMLDIPLLFSYFLQFSAPSVCDRFFQYFKNKDGQPEGILPIIVLYPLLSFVLFVGIYWIYKDSILSLFLEKSPLIVSYALFILPITVLMMYISILEAYLRAHLNVLFSAFLREIGIRLFFMLAAFLFYKEYLSIDGVVMLYILAYTISLLALIIYLNKLKLLNFKFRFQHISKKTLTDIAWYVIFLLPGSAGAMIIQKLDSLMLGSMKGLKHVAVYSIAFFIGTVVEVPKRSFVQIGVPIISKALKENDTKTISTLYVKGSLIQFLIGSIILILIWINVDELIALIPNSEVYREGKYVILFIGLSKLCDMATSVNLEIIQYSKYYKMNTYSTIALVVTTLLLNLWLIPIYNVVGAALAIMIVVIGVNTFRTLFLYHTMRLNPFSSDTWIVLLFFLFWMLISQYSHFIVLNNFIEVLISISSKSLLVLVSAYILVKKYGLSYELNEVIQRVESKLKWR